jgi:hypothetical protein
VGLADDWDDNKGKTSWLQNVVRVILSIKIDRSLRPFQESRDDITHGGLVNLTVRELLPTFGLVRHHPTNDHEAPF